jgi:DNA-binding NarL/FixJ family response regulator
VDDHPRVREELRDLLQWEPDLEVCGEAADAASALPLIQREKPDLLILDIMLAGANGLDLLEALKQWQSNLQVLILSMREEALYVERAFRAGAKGYLAKAEAPVSILPAVRQVLAGQVYVSERLARRLGRALPGPGQPMGHAVSR